MGCKVTITKNHEGRRLDRTIRSIWPALPLSLIMSSLRKGEVRLDAVKVKEAGARVGAGQELYVPWEPPDCETRRPKAAEAGRRFGVVPVIWRGGNAAIIDKPANLLVQPDVKDGDSVITRVWGMFGRGELGFSPAAVHRLDRNTTGALAVALSGGALRELERLFKERLVRKRYLAVVVGELPEKGTVDAPLLKDEERNTVKVEAGGKTALTRYSRLGFTGELSLVSIELMTGRTHQARVHMAHIGHPILGDRKYGDIEANRRRRDAKRPLLHAFELRFPEGLSGELAEVSGRTFRAPIPEDMAALLQRENLGGVSFGNFTL